MHFEFTDNPVDTDIKYLTDQINIETLEYGIAAPFAFFIKINSAIIAGCNGYTFYDVIYLDQLWVDKSLRKQSLGKKLMLSVFDYGLKKNCKMATVATMSFQNAEQFYIKLGFVKEYEHFGYVKNSSNIFYSKKLI